MIHNSIHTNILTCREDHVAEQYIVRREWKNTKEEKDKKKKTESSGKRAIMVFFVALYTLPKTARYRHLIGRLHIYIQLSYMKDYHQSNMIEPYHKIDRHNYLVYFFRKKKQQQFNLHINTSYK
mgnify:CR=1 FL=1